MLEILREGEVGSRAEVLRRILGEVRGEGERKEMGKAEGDGDADSEGRGKGNEEGGGKENGNEEDIKKTDIRIPEKGIKEGTRIVWDVLETCVKIEPEKPEKDFWA